MLRIEYVYWLCGALFLAAGGFDLDARRYASAAFWGILAACFLAGDAIETAAAAGNTLPAQLAGVGVIALALIAGSGALKRRETGDGDLARRRASAERLRNRLFLPALAIPLVTLVLIVSILDLLGIAQAALADPNWVGMNKEAYAFAGLIYWMGCFGLSRVGLALERARSKGERR